MKSKLTRVVVWIAAVVLVLLGLPVLSPLLGQLVVRLPFGWINFLQRVVPRVEWNWSGIGMVVLCSVLIVGGTQWFCRWLYAHLRRPAASDAPAHWRWSWSVALYAMLWLMFCAIMGAVGVAHQATWMLRSKEPLYVERSTAGTFRIGLRMQAMEVTMLAEQTGWDLAEVRKGFYENQTSPGHRMKPNGIEDLQVLFIEGQAGKLAAAILLYRDAKKREKAGIVVTTPSLNSEEYDFSKLPEVLAKYQR